MRAFVAAAASTAASVAFQVSIALWPNELQHWSWAVKYLWYVSGVLWLVWIATSPAVRRVFGKIDSSGSDKLSFPPINIAPVISTTISPTISQGQANSPEVADRHAEEPEPGPNSLRFVQVERVRVDGFGCIWRRREDGPVWALVGIVRNDPGERGRRTNTVRGVTAHLTYRNPDNVDERELFINFGAWIGEYTHFVSFAPGQTQSLILALVKSKQLCALDNPHTSNPMAGRMRPGRSIYPPTEKEIIWSSGELEVNLVDRDGVTVYARRFLYEFDVGGIMSVRPIE